MPRWNRRGTERVYFLTALASQTSPSAAAIVAGTRLDTVLRSLSGFTSQKEDLDAADMSSTWGKTIPGGETPEASSMTFFEGDNAADAEVAVRTALAEGTTGFIVFSPAGVPAATKKADVFPVRIKANNADKTADNASATFTVGFSIYDPPSKNVTQAA